VNFIKPLKNRPHAANDLFMRTDWQNYKTACLDISLHNRYQEGVYLAGAFHWVSKRFEKCLINFGDTLHRHNLGYVCDSAQKAHDEARALGDQWIEDNLDCFQHLQIPYCFIRGDDWLVDLDFEATHQALWAFYRQDKGLQATIESDVQGFVSRADQNIKDADMRQASIAYLIEEAATDILLGQRGGVAHLYPADRHQCYYYLIENTHRLPSGLSGLENSAFKRLSPSKISLKSRVAKKA
jgi:tRNA-dependent cyclodipeptide synthase